jgi:hypothetical protein
MTNSLRTTSYEALLNNKKEIIEICAGFYNDLNHLRINFLTAFKEVILTEELRVRGLECPLRARRAR